MKLSAGVARCLGRLALTLGGLYLLLCAGFSIFQRSLLYFPPPCAGPLPQKSIRLHSDDIDLIVAVRPRTGPAAMIYFGGNGEDVSASMATYAAAFPTRALYLLNYRSYGGSGGRPSEAAFQRDALALFDTVQRSHADIVVIGRSLGSGVAVHLATQRPVSQLILVTPYASILALAQQHCPYFPVRWMLQDKFESWRDAPFITTPMLLIAAESDRLVPRASTLDLARYFTCGAARLAVIAATNHNTISQSADYSALLTRAASARDRANAPRRVMPPVQTPAADAAPENPVRRHNA